MKNGIKRLAGFIIMAIILVVLVSSIIDNEDRKLNYSELINKIETSKVTEIELNAKGKTAYVILEGETAKREVNIPDTGSFMDYPGFKTFN